MAAAVKRATRRLSSTVCEAVDRLWPRGLTKKDAAVKRWLRDLAPSTELRHGSMPIPGCFLRKRYLKELVS
jgi:uncharacterized protein YeaO (DUF488 family)